MVVKDRNNGQIIPEDRQIHILTLSRQIQILKYGGKTGIPICICGRNIYRNNIGNIK